MLQHHSLLVQFLNLSSDTAGGPKGSSQSSSTRASGCPLTSLVLQPGVTESFPLALPLSTTYFEKIMFQEQLILSSRSNPSSFARENLRHKLSSEHIEDDRIASVLDVFPPCFPSNWSRCRMEISAARNGSFRNPIRPSSG